MADPSLATITGRMSRDVGVMSAGSAVTQPERSVVLRFTPDTLDTAGIPSLDAVDAVIDADGALVSRETGGPVLLWPGSWTVTAFGKPVAGLPFTFTVADGQTADLYDLRGFVPGPGVIAHTVFLDAITGETLPPGSPVTVTDTGSGVVLGIPQGDPGPDGLSAYQVAVANGFSGTEAEWLASLDGTPGAAATVAVGSTSTLVPGSAATVTNAGSSSAALLDFGIPAGQPGADGPAGTVAVGTTTTGAAGSSASVTNSGTSSAAVLDFVVPQGAPGSPTAYELRGSGSPYGVVTPASAGIYYTDTAATNGAIRWVSTGTTNTSWIVTVGDTGWRKVIGWTSGTVDTGTVPSGLAPQAGVTGGIFYRRTLERVRLSIVGALTTSTSSAVPIPTGFDPGGVPYPDLFMAGGAGMGVELKVGGSNIYFSFASGIQIPNSGWSSYASTAQWVTSRAWPTVLPGIPV